MVWKLTPCLFEAGGETGPCKAYTPIVETVSNEMTDVDFGAMNIDQHPNVPTKFGRQPPFLLKGGTSCQTNGVRGIPTTILIIDGELKATKVGMTNQSDLVAWLKSNI